MEIYIFGMIGGTIGICSQIPQLVKSWRTKRTRDISTGTYLLLVANMSFWVAHGLANDDPVIYITNAIAVLFPIGILLLKFRFK